MKTNRLYRILRIIYTTCLWKPDLFTLSFLIPWSSYWKEQWSSHHEQRKKDQPCSNCKWSFLEVSEQPFSECNLNVIVNVIGVFRGFPKFSQIDRNRWKLRLFGTYIVSNLSPGDASSPVSRTTEPLENQGVPIFYVRKYPNRTQTLPNGHMFSMKACILFADSRRMVSVTWP